MILSTSGIKKSFLTHEVLRNVTFHIEAKEKMALILIMSRNASLYVLDEPIAGVDPAARDYIISTIINNYNPDSSVLISTHLISDIEDVLDEVVFLKNGQVKYAGGREIITPEVVKDTFDVDVSVREIDGRTVVLNCSA